MTRPIIFTFGSVPEHPGFVRLRNSCDKHGWEMDPVSGPWPGERGMWQLFFDALPGYRDRGFTHALRLDAFDTAMLGPPSELEAALEHYGSPRLLMSAEGAPWPGNYRLDDYPKRENLFWFAHSPLTVDLVQGVPPRFLDMPHRTGYGDDQQCLADMILDGEPGVAIDRDCRVVQSLGHATPWQDYFEIGVSGTVRASSPAETKFSFRLHNKITGSYPLACHGNGIQCVPEWVP